MRGLLCALVVIASPLAAQAGEAREPTAEERAQARQILAACAGENDTHANAAIEACSFVLGYETREDPWDHIRVLRGSAFIDVEDYDAAITDFDAVLSRAPTQWDVLALRAVARSSRGDIKGAHADITQAVTLKPDDHAVHYLAGFVHELNGDPAAAIASFSRVLALKPGLRDALFVRGALYERQDANDKALADYSVLVALDPRDVLARHARGALYAQLGRAAEAKTDFMAAAYVERRSTKAERNSEPTPSLDGEFYVRPCKLPDGTFAPAEWVRGDPTKPRTYDYSESHTDPETGLCIKDILAKHPDAMREKTATLRPNQRERTLESDAAGARERDSVGVFERSGASGGSEWVAPPSRMSNGTVAPGSKDFDALAPSRSTQPLKPPQYIPYEPRAVTSDAPPPRRRTVLPNAMDTRYNPFETIEEARHGRGRRYDPYATHDSWAVDRSNPYAIAPAFKHKGIFNPFAGSATPYNPKTTLGGGYEINNWQTNRYDPFGTQRSSPIVSGDKRVPLTPLHPPTNCPNKSSNPLNPYAPRSC